MSKYEWAEEATEVTGFCLENSIKIIDARFGEGFANRNSDILGDVLNAYVRNLQACQKREQLNVFAERLRGMEESLDTLSEILSSK